MELPSSAHGAFDSALDNEELSVVSESDALLGTGGGGTDGAGTLGEGCTPAFALDSARSIADGLRFWPQCGMVVVDVPTNDV